MDKLLEQYANVPPRQRWGGVAAIVLAMIGGYAYFFYGDQAERINQLKNQATKLEGDRAKAQAVVDNLAKYEARLTELQQKLNEARAQLPDDADVPQLLAQLDNKARQAGLYISRFEPKGEQPKDFYADINFEMAVRGSYHEMGAFIDSVGKLDRIINVLNISMSNPKTENQKVLVDGTFTIKAYRFIEKPAEEAKAQAKGKRKPKGGK